MIRQVFIDFQGRVSNVDRVHKDGYTDDDNGSRWKEGAWRPRRGVSRMSAGTTAGTAVESVQGYQSNDGTRYLSSIQGAKWVVAAIPDIAWGD